MCEVPILDLKKANIVEVFMKKSKASYQFNFGVAPKAYVEEHMEYYGYSYEKFADLCGCSVRSVKEIVIDNKPLTPKLAKKFEKEPDIPVHVLM